MKEALGEEKFKIILKYDIIQVSSVTKQCQTVDRFCRKNLPYKAEWTEVDFSLCSPKAEPPKRLLLLNQVGEILEVFYFIVVTFYEMNQNMLTTLERIEYRNLKWISYNNLKTSILKEKYK